MNSFSQPTSFDYTPLVVHPLLRRKVYIFKFINLVISLVKVVVTNLLKLLISLLNLLENTLL